MSRIWSYLQNVVCDKKSLIQADELTVCIFDYQRGAHRRTPHLGAYLLPF
jgi:hypothetical protein